MTRMCILPMIQFQAASWMMIIVKIDTCCAVERTEEERLELEVLMNEMDDIMVIGTKRMTEIRIT